MERDEELAPRVPARLTASEGRRFAIAVGGAFLAIGALLLWRGREALSLAAASVGTVVLLAGLLAPDRLGPARRAWMGLAHALSKVTTPVLMALIFFLVITPAGLLARAFGHRPLRRTGGSVWVARPADRRRSDLQRQF